MAVPGLAHLKAIQEELGAELAAHQRAPADGAHTGSTTSTGEDDMTNSLASERSSKSDEHNGSTSSSCAPCRLNVMGLDALHRTWDPISGRSAVHDGTTGLSSWVLGDRSQDFDLAVLRVARQVSVCREGHELTVCHSSDTGFGLCQWCCHSMAERRLRCEACNLNFCFHCEESNLDEETRESMSVLNEKLHNGWKAAYDMDARRVYFYHEKSGERSWLLERVMYTDMHGAARKPPLSYYSWMPAAKKQLPPHRQHALMLLLEADARRDDMIKEMEASEAARASKALGGSQEPASPTRCARGSSGRDVSPFKEPPMLPPEAFRKRAKGAALWSVRASFSPMLGSTQPGHDDIPTASSLSPKSELASEGAEPLATRHQEEQHIETTPFGLEGFVPSSEAMGHSNACQVARAKPCKIFIC